MRELLRAISVVALIAFVGAVLMVVWMAREGQYYQNFGINPYTTISDTGLAGSILFGMAGVTNFVLGIIVLTQVNRAHPDRRGLVTAAGILAMLFGLLLLNIAIVVIAWVASISPEPKKTQPAPTATTGA